MKAVGSSSIKGAVRAPASKSVMIRAVAASLLADGTSHLSNPSACADSLAALAIAETLGARIEHAADTFSITGTGGFSKQRFQGNRILCGESGLCMRMFTPIAGLTDRLFTVDASGSLRSRPMTILEKLQRLGLDCSTTGGYPPVTVKGPLQGGTIFLDGSESSQFLTGLLMATPLCPLDSIITVSNLKSRPYIAMTIDLLRGFGIAVDCNEDFTSFGVPGGQAYKPQRYRVEGDWSGAAFLLVAGAIAGSITVQGLKVGSFQADEAVLEALTLAGARVIVTEEGVEVERDHLRAFEFDAGHCPDLVPPLTALASYCEGRSTIYGIERLKHKESNRAEALFSEFAKLGIRIDLLTDRMDIHGGRPTGNLVDAHNDHRIAMACAVAALDGSGPVVIEGFKCVEKSYPSFFEDLDSVRIPS